jgi:hypothetical protein
MHVVMLFGIHDLTWSMDMVYYLLIYESKKIGVLFANKRKTKKNPHTLGTN